MNVLALFSGVGAWSLGLEPLGFRVVAAVEREPLKRALHRAVWPDVPVFRDIRKVTGDAVRRGIGSIDCIVGSPPCTDASAANTRGRGIDGSETGLFREAVRLVRELRPRWACFENSPRMRTRGVDRVLGWLEEAGYAAWPLVVGADHLGAPHERDRVWIVAHNPDGEYPAKGTQISDSCGLGAGNVRTPTYGRRDVSGDAAPTARIGRSSEGRWGRQDGVSRRDDSPGDVADADSRGLRIKPRRRGGPDGEGEAVHPADDRDAAREQVGRAGLAWQDDPAEGGNTNGAGQPLGQSLGSNLIAQLAASERTAWLLEHPWAGGLVRHLRVVDELSAGFPPARLGDCRSMYGDAVIPQVVALIGRAILAAEAGRVAA